MPSKRSATLLIAKLDRLGRYAHFLPGLQKAGIWFIAADMSESNELVVGIMAVIAQAERNMISDRTKKAVSGHLAVRIRNERFQRVSEEQVI